MYLVYGSPTLFSHSYSAEQPCTMSAADCHGSSSAVASSDISSSAEDSLHFRYVEKQRVKGDLKETESSTTRTAMEMDWLTQNSHV